MGEGPVLRIDGLVFRWPRQAAPCLDIPAFSVAPGERVFIHGPSGSGKSTLLGLLGGVLTPQQGSLRLLETELTRLPPAARDRLRANHIGFLFQQFNLIPYLSVMDNVVLPCRFSALRRRRAGANGHRSREEAARLLDHLDIAPALRERPATELSVGQQQRVAAARALMGRPEIVIADEPTSALDAERQTAFLDLLQRECREAGTTLVFVSHDRRLAARFDREVALAELNRAVPEGEG